MSHTPTPWKVGDPLDRSRHRPITQEPVGQTIAYVHYSQTMPTQANAEYIVRAVNSHAELLAALEALILAEEQYGDPSNVAINEVLDPAYRALAKAKAKS